jgi:hypothetical protein
MIIARGDAALLAAAATHYCKIDRAVSGSGNGNGDGGSVVNTETGLECGTGVGGGAVFGCVGTRELEDCVRRGDAGLTLLNAFETLIRKGDLLWSFAPQDADEGKSYASSCSPLFCLNVTMCCMRISILSSVCIDAR